MISAYPLHWPAGWPRNTSRERARFNKQERQYGQTTSWTRKRQLSVSDGVERVLEAVTKLGVDRQDVIVSTNVRTRLDGLPRSGEPEPKDPGAAVYWRERDGTDRVIAVDQYDRVADNLAAIAGTLDAMRAIERWGGAQILERAFTGFTALPSPDAARPWWEVLGCARDASREEITDAYRRAASANHPDRNGGSDTAMATINLAYAEATK